MSDSLTRMDKSIGLRPQRPVQTPLGELVPLVEGRAVVGVDVVPTTLVSGLALDSRLVCPGDLYAAVPGAQAHGAEFTAAALAAGAVAVLTDDAGAALIGDPGVPVVVPVLVTDRLRARIGGLAARIFGDPAEALTLIAVTGTQGKTTTTRLLENGLTAAGQRAAVIGTVGTRIAGVDVRTSLTTPESPALHGLFASMREVGVTVCGMEVSSHALVMGRVDGVVFDVAAFTNLGRDHLDFHRDMEDYFAAKASLFTPERARRGLANIDDPWGRRLVEIATIPMRTFALDGDADWTAGEIQELPAGSRFRVHGPGGVDVPARVPIAGRFNVSNALCAIAAAAEAGLDPAAVADGIAHGDGVPGRLERIEEGQPFLAVVDYAHKPDALEAALDALRPVTAGRLILVLGAGGDRDQGKRPLMGRIGSARADVLVVTDDNPRTEDPAAIRAAIREGASGPAEVQEIGDRRAAIRAAVELARPGDTVIVAGKGHETGQEIAGEVHHFDDRDEVRAAIRNIVTEVAE